MGGGDAPKVSVIIPVYNTADYLAGCVESVQAQTYRNLEILLVDDGSTDGSGALCRELGEGDGRIRLIAQDHRGVSAARNRALDACTGDYILFMDSDDLIHPLLIERYVRSMLETPADLIYCAYTRFIVPPEAEEFVSVIPKPVPFPPQRSERQFHQGKMRGIGGKCIRSGFLGTLRFDEEIPYGEDALFNCRLLTKGAGVLFFNAPWYYYRQRPGSAVAALDENIGVELEHIKRLRDYAYSGGASGAMQWEQRLSEVLRSSYLRAGAAHREALCRDLRERFLTEREHPLFAALPPRERAAALLCFGSPLVYRAARTAAHFCKSAAERAASARRGGAPICRAVQKGGELCAAVTFDTIYGADNMEVLLRILERNHVPATFFVSGIWVEAFPDKAAELRERGFEVMSLSDTLLHLTQCGEEEILDELENSRRKIEAAAGIRPSLVRCPYGDYDARVLESAEKAGMKVVQWSVDSLDWKETTTEEELYRRVLSQTGPGGIIRFRNSGRYTPRVLERILVSLKEKGCRFATVSELLSPGAGRP